MPIVVRCECGTTLRARDEQAGRTCRCPRCGSALQVPYPVARIVDPPPERAQAQPAIAPEQEKPTPVIPPGASPVTAALIAHRARGPQPMKPVAAAPPPVALTHLQKCERTFRGHIYWVLILFVIPLVYSTFIGDFNAQTIKEKIARQINPPATSPADGEEELEDPSEKFEEEMQFADLDELLASIPGKRLEGAFLARDSYAHWLFAIVATLLYFAIVAVAIPCEDVSPGQLLLAGLFTATVGVGLLLTFQHFGMCFCLIGLWYVAAMHPDAPFGPSLLGFILGVGICEEITKCIPVLWRIHRQDIGWREACLIGMASGAGFGISEGIHYCTNFYNGIAPLSIYLVRFISSCGLHVLLSGACGIMIFRKQKHLSEWFDPYDWVLTISALMIVPIVLHGLFNALLKVEMDAAALGVWLAAFAWLAWMIKISRRDELKQAAVTAVAASRFVKTEKGTRYVGGEPLY